MIITNRKKNYIYFNKNTNKTHDNIFDLLNVDIVKFASLQNHEKNISNFFIRPDLYQEVLHGIYPIPPQTRWLYDEGKFFCLNDTSVNFNTNFSDFLYTIRRLSSVLRNKKIAIELSGGLDTSLIIGLMHHLGINPFLIGIRSKRYELRTEAFVQDDFCKKFNNVQFINGEKTLPFTKITEAPRHQLPSSSSIYFMFAKLMAKECNSNNIDILLSGMGFDALLCDNIYSNGSNKVPNHWFKWVLDDHWFNENVYSKMNITYKSAAYSQLLIKLIWLLRSGQDEDSKKVWARNFFKDFLPKELVYYSYKADNSGGFLDGFLNAKKEIEKIFRLAYAVTEYKEFSPVALEDLYYNSHLVDEKKDKKIIATVSFAIWIYTLIRDKAIDYKYDINLNYI